MELGGTEEAGACFYPRKDDPDANSGLGAGKRRFPPERSTAGGGKRSCGHGIFWLTDKAFATRGDNAVGRIGTFACRRILHSSSGTGGTKALSRLGTQPTGTRGTVKTIGGSARSGAPFDLPRTA